MNLIQNIKTKINSVLSEAEVYVVDPDGEHFESLVISPDFENLSLVKQHQLVMNALKDDFEGQLHSLALKTFTPQKWKNERHKYKLDGN